MKELEKKHNILEIQTIFSFGVKYLNHRNQTSQSKSAYSQLRKPYIALIIKRWRNVRTFFLITIIYLFSLELYICRTLLFYDILQLMRLSEGFKMDIFLHVLLLGMWGFVRRITQGYDCTGPDILRALQNF